MSQIGESMSQIGELVSQLSESKRGLVSQILPIFEMKLLLWFFMSMGIYRAPASAVYIYESLHLVGEAEYMKWRGPEVGKQL